MIISSNEQIVPSLDMVAHLLVQSEANRKKMIQLFGELAVRDQLQNISDDLEESFLETPWKANDDGTWSANEMVMQKGADGTFRLKLDQLLANPQALAMVKTMSALQDQLAARLAKNPPPTMEEIKSYGRLIATTQGAN